MKRKATLLTHIYFVVTLTTLLASHASNQTPPAASSANQSAPIPMDQLGAVAGKQYQGDGLSVIATPDGASLRCAFQRLEGQVTREGLWLSSTADNNSGERFRVVAMEVGRAIPNAPLEEFGFNDIFRSVAVPGHSDATDANAYEQSAPLLLSTPLRPGTGALRKTGSVSVTDNVARFIRPGLTEEYTVSVDGVRQDFIIEQRPEGDGELRLELDVTGARAEPLVNGARLVLDGSGRKLAYNRLRVTDATGRELPARMEVPDQSEIRNQKSEIRLAVLVDDAAAIYPVRIDPTFSDADWISMNASIPGVNGQVLAVAVDASGNLYIGGNFSVVGGMFANRIAKWNGSAWVLLGSGMNGSVLSLAVSGGDLYAGGYFTTAGGNPANRIAKWNGSSWTALGSGLSGTVFPLGPGVFALAVSGDVVYAGGEFTTAGGSAASCIARWDGTNWTSLGSGMGGVVFPASPSIYALALLGNELYAGGNFTTAGGNPANRVAKWSGTNWVALSTGMNATVYALAVLGSDAYAGGAFTTSGGITANRIAKWNGSSWTALGTGMNSNVTALMCVGSNLYAGGAFTTAGGIVANRIAKWNGSGWSTVGSGMDGTVSALAVSANNIFAGGLFSAAGGNTASRIAKWNSSNWSAINVSQTSVPLYVVALAVSGSDLYAGGRVPTVNGNILSHVAKWNGNNWTTLGSGMNGTVFALAVSGSNIYAGGIFTTAGGNTVNSVAKWNGSNWMPLGQGMAGLNRYGRDQIVYALAISGDDLFVGGNFSTVNGNISAECIAKWNGINWTALGLGIGTNFPTVRALAVSGNNLYVGGNFTTAGGISANAIARWDGNGWSAMNSGLGADSLIDPTVYSITISAGDVFAGGFFTSAGGNSATNVAKWNGNTWSALGDGTSGMVFALSAFASNVYAGGNFTTAGGSTAKYIARWDGITWSPLGSGMNEFVAALGVVQGNLYVGGSFTTAGDKASPYLAKANISGLPFPGKFTNLLHSPVTGFSCTFLDASVGQPYRIQTSPSLAAGSWTDFTNFTYTAPVVITVPIAGNTNRFFRAITP